MVYLLMLVFQDQLVNWGMYNVSNVNECAVMRTSMKHTARLPV